MILKKNKKNKIASEDNKKMSFGDEGYVMKKHYNADELIVAKLERVSSIDNGFSPKTEITDQKYIFEQVITQNGIEYREIFTGFITQEENDAMKKGIMYFDMPYVSNPEKFTDYMPDTIGISMPKLSLIWTLNDINNSKNIKKENKEYQLIKKQK